MLIICYDDFLTEMQPFVVHKNNIGLYTEMYRLSSVGTTPAEIKQFIKDKFDADNQLTFVLLVGDNAQVPTFTYGGGGSDPQYSLLAGNDNYPDVIVGRFSAENSDQVTTMVNRTINYETTPHQESAWFKRGIGIASAQGPGDDNQYDYQHIREIRNVLLNWNYNAINELYDGSQGGIDAVANPTSSMVAADINNGVSLINYTGHGSVTGWGTSGFSNTHVMALNNINQLPFIFSVACVNGNFTNNTCFAEAWLRASNQQPTGAIGFYGSSINQLWSPPMEAQDKFNEYLVNEQFETFGELCFAGSCAMIDRYENSGIDMFLTWIYFGDPSVSYIDQCPFDLLIRDTDDDDGTEPNPTNQHTYRSPNIWVRNIDDDELTHEDPINNALNYVYVRVENKGNQPSLGTEKLHLYWSKSNTNLSWPDGWTGGLSISGLLLGDYIDSIDIPSIQPGGETIVKFQWNVPDGNDYENYAEKGHFCLLARIVASNDAMYSDNGSNIDIYVKKNNNVAQKNVSILHIGSGGGSIGGLVVVGNMYNQPHSSCLQFRADEGSTLPEAATITVKLDDVLYQAWQRGGAIADNAEEIGEQIFVI
ncbi:MAG: C25 family cysteine peptidase, partial [Bacteroidales bacterium]|nr:C25 family cysteine peptidase [Bacteroidales bacterium]